MRGSKYIQSRMGGCFAQVKSDLEQGRKVLFSGTSCQISGLKGYLKKDYQNLLLVDIVCHGVPSPLVWKEYLTWNEKKFGGKIVKVDFRNKNHFGWAAHVESLWIKKGNKNKQIDSRVFRKLFYGHYILRPSCYKCPYRTTNHPSDITIADYWGIDKAVPGFNDNKGVSLVLINNEKGLGVFLGLEGNVTVRSALIEDSMQKPFYENPKRPKNRELFWSEFNTLPFDKVVQKYAKYRLKERIKDWLKKLFIKGK